MKATTVYAVIIKACLSPVFCKIEYLWCLDVGDVGEVPVPPQVGALTLLLAPQLHLHPLQHTGGHKQIQINQVIKSKTLLQQCYIYVIILNMEILANNIYCISGVF